MRYRRMRVRGSVEWRDPISRDSLFFKTGRNWPVLDDERRRADWSALKIFAIFQPASVLSRKSTPRAPRSSDLSCKSEPRGADDVNQTTRL